MKINIYQIDTSRDMKRVAFLPYTRMKELSELDSSIYNLVYSNDIDSYITLERIYCIFNNKLIEDFYGRSVSISDVIEIRGSHKETDGFYYVDSTGFRAINFNPEKAAKGFNVLLVKVGCAPKMMLLANTTEAFQNAVGGYFQAVQPWYDEVALICNEEGKLKELLPNRIIKDENGRPSFIIFGDFLIVGAKNGDENFSSLDKKTAEKYARMF